MKKPSVPVVFFVVSLALAVGFGALAEVDRVVLAAIDILAVAAWGAAFVTVLADARRVRAEAEIEQLQPRAANSLSTVVRSAETYVFLVTHTWTKSDRSPANFDQMVDYSKQITPDAEALLRELVPLKAGDLAGPVLSKAESLLGGPDFVLNDQLESVVAGLKDYEVLAEKLRSQKAEAAEKISDYSAKILSPFAVALAVSLSIFSILAKA